VSAGPWRIGRNHKMQFSVFREAEGEREFRCSASGKETSFRTWAGASRAAWRLNRDAGIEAELREKYAGLAPMEQPTMRTLARAARGGA
jgi:hypothetical protein